MDKTTDSITRDELLRAIGATIRRIDRRSTGDEALEDLAREIENPHTCVAAFTYMLDNVGPCETCGQAVSA